MTAPTNPFTGRQIVYTNEVPYEWDVLYSNLYKMMDIGMLAMSSLMPASTLQAANPNNFFLAYNLLCTPTSPASLSVNMGPGGGSSLGGIGGLFGYVPVDANNYGVISANTTDNIFKPFIQTTSNSPVVVGPVTNTLTAGQSVIWLLEAQPITSDANNTNRPYFNAAAPETPVFITQPQNRIDYVQYQLKMGTPTTGTPVAPTADAGWVPLYNITVAFGQTSITAGNIAVNANAPFITESLTQKISQASGDARYLQASSLQASAPIYAVAGGTANAITATPSPAYGSVVAGTILYLLAASTNTGPTTIAINGLGPFAVFKKTPVGIDALVGGEIVSGSIYTLFYDGTVFELLDPSTVTLPVLQTTTSSTSIPTTKTSIPWNAAADNYTCFTLSGTTITANVTGWYEFNVKLLLQNNSGGAVFLSLFYNTSTLIDETTIVASDIQSVSADFKIFLNASNTANFQTTCGTATNAVLASNLNVTFLGN